MVNENENFEENQELYEEELEVYVNVNEVQEEIGEDLRNQAPEDDDEEMEVDGEYDDDDALEIDMSNNSWTYFDQHKDSVFTVFKSPTHPMVVTGGGDDTAFMWTTHTQPPRFVGELQGHKESVIAGGFTGDGKFVITGDMNGYIQVHTASKGGQKWSKFADLEEVEEVLWIEVHSKLPYFAFGAPDGSVWCYQIDDASQSLVQIMSGFSHSLECNGGVFINQDTTDENELTLVTISEDGTVVNWNCFTGAVNYKLNPHGDFKNIESPWVTIKALKNLVAVGGRDGQLAIINELGKIVHSVETLENAEDEAELSIEALSWCQAPLLNLLAVGLVSGDVLLFDTLQWRIRSTLKVEDTITKLEFIEKSPLLVGSSMNGKIYVWDARSSSEVFVCVGHNMGVLDFVTVDNGKKLISAGDEGVSLVFELPN